MSLARLWIWLDGLLLALAGGGALLCTAHLTATPARALEGYVEGGVGMSVFQRTVPDGTWVQEAFPHKFHWQSPAYRIGLGVKLTDSWSIGLNYLNLGTVKSQTGFVLDENYDPTRHVCVRQCAAPQYGRATNSLQGGELIATYTYRRWLVEPYVRGGVALVRHDLSWQVDGDGTNFMHGLMVMGVGGVGACVRWVCADVSYYKGVSQSQFPLSTAVIVPMLTMRIPFSY